MPSGAGRNARLVLDARYKVADDPSRGDIAQVVAYVEAKGCRDAALIYPVPLPVPLDETIGEIRVRSMTFWADGDLGQAGERFLGNLIAVRSVLWRGFLTSRPSPIVSAQRCSDIGASSRRYSVRPSGVSRGLAAGAGTSGTPGGGRRERPQGN